MQAHTKYCTDTIFFELAHTTHLSQANRTVPSAKQKKKTTTTIFMCVVQRKFMQEQSVQCAQNLFLYAKKNGICT